METFVFVIITKSAPRALYNNPGGNVARMVTDSL